MFSTRIRKSGSGSPPVQHNEGAFFQPKLTINAPGDQYEQEADAMAERVVQTPRSQVPVSAAGAAASVQRQVEDREEEPVQRKCADCEQKEKERLQRQEKKEEEQLQRQPEQEEEHAPPVQTKPLMRKNAGGGYSATPALSTQLSASKGQGTTLPAPTRTHMESAFGADFSQVRIHADDRAADMNAGVNARAFTHGSDIYFNKGQYAPESGEGRKLMAHELTHVVQQWGSPKYLQRQSPPRGSDVTVSSPVLDETLTQFSNVQGELQGRPLTSRELALAQTVFGKSIDYSKVRIIHTNIAARTTPGNTIRLPVDFSIEIKQSGQKGKPVEPPLNQENAQLLIHEMTHVWQFQHRGPSYISTSLGQQLAESIAKGNRNFAYEYRISNGDSFFDFGPEQQAFIVENYFVMLRDKDMIARGAKISKYLSNHLESDGYKREITAIQRQAEIQAELPLHENLIRQMNTAVPLKSSELMQIRQKSLMMQPISGSDAIPRGSGLPQVQTPVLLEVRF